MKTKFFAIAAIAATAMFSSCNKDNATSEERGEATTMKVSINFPIAAQTRANTTADPNGTANESQVNTVDIFIYYSGSGAFESHATLTAADFTQTTSTGTADVYQYTAATKIPTTTGSKSVFAGINLPSGVVSALTGRNMSELSTAVHTMSRTEFAGATNFAMFSVRGENSTFVADDTDPANNVSITCQRLVAKVTVETSATVTTGGVPGTLGDLEFVVNNFNTKVFMLQGAAPDRKDPNWDVYNAGDFNDGTDYAPVWNNKRDGAPASIADYTPRYAAENTSMDKLRKGDTRVTVRSTFIPDEITVGTTGNFTTDDNHGITVPQTFWAVTPPLTGDDAQTRFFFTETVAIAFATEIGAASPVEFTNGYCYWSIYLGKTNSAPNKWDVLRNDYYKCNITKILTPGTNHPGEVDPEVTPDNETKITADINILFWHPVPMADYELE